MNRIRQVIANILNAAAWLLSLPSAVMADIASLVWDENNDER